MNGQPEFDMTEQELLELVRKSKNLKVFSID